MDGYMHLSTSVSSSSNSSEVRILSTTLYLHTRGEGASPNQK